MAESKESKKKNETYHQAANSGGGAVYGIGLIGALIYFVGHADTIWQAFLGILQAFVWPAYVVYKLLQMFYG